MSTPDDVPELVRTALRNSLSTGWMQTTRNETGRLLAALAASRSGRVAEVGAGSGAGVSWLRHGAPASTEVLCVERDPETARRARETLAGSAIEVLDGACEVLRERAPFSLLYLSRSTAEHTGTQLPWELVEPGGMVVVDDFTPAGELAAHHDWASHEATVLDPVRQGWLTDERFSSTEVAVAGDVSVVLAVRR